ncbi:hypothetical protein [Luteimonas abyssi]|uniref:hypothetical protein n=1 Tax=Luteimonas abyssi TaxID=1247514 RepID=UPI000AC0714A|nr:hypothetical protein [Luteimonas abyssi]
MTSTVSGSRARRIRFRVLQGAMLAFVLVMLAGTTSARWPIPGVEWAEWTNYDAAGNAIGGGRIECEGDMRTWGDPGRPGPFTLYPCP